VSATERVERRRIPCANLVHSRFACEAGIGLAAAVQSRSTRSAYSIDPSQPWLSRATHRRRDHGSGIVTAVTIMHSAKTVLYGIRPRWCDGPDGPRAAQRAHSHLHPFGLSPPTCSDQYSMRRSRRNAQTSPEPTARVPGSETEKVSES
jgi:hypothetical protein